jgi:hypothetical protein
VLETWRIGSAAGVLLTVTTLSSVAHGDEGVAAQVLFDQGKKLAAAHNYAEACPKFEESQRLEPALGTLLNLADCYEHQGKLASAWIRFLELSAKARAAGHTERARIGHDRAAALGPRLSNLVISVPDASRVDGLEVQRDGTRVGPAEWGTPIPADPGAHTISASAQARKPWSTSVTVADGAKTATVVVPELALAPVEAKAQATKPAGIVTHDSTSPFAETPPPNRGLPPQKILALVSGGLGVVGVGLGSYAGLVAISKRDDAFKTCPSRTCTPGVDPQAAVASESDSQTWGNVSTVAFIVGGVGLAAAAVLWFTAPKSDQSPPTSAALTVGPGAIQFSGTW